jgi:hypothetical protein
VRTVAAFRPDEDGFSPVTWLTVGVAGLVVAAGIAVWGGRLRPGAMWVSMLSWIVFLGGFTRMLPLPRWLALGALAIALAHWWILGMVWGLAIRDADGLELVFWFGAVTTVQATLALAAAVVAGTRGTLGAVWAGSAWLVFVVACLVR